jgi:hypothetical protein
LSETHCDVCAHAFRDDAHRYDERTLVDFGRYVERARFAVDDDFRLADRHLDVGAGLRNVDGFRRRIVRDRSTHLLEHRTQRNKDRIPAHQGGQDATLFQFVGLRVDMLVVE